MNRAAATSPSPPAPLPAQAPVTFATVDPPAPLPAQAPVTFATVDQTLQIRERAGTLEGFWQRIQDARALARDRSLAVREAKEALAAAEAEIRFLATHDPEQRNKEARDALAARMLHQDPAVGAARAALRQAERAADDAWDNVTALQDSFTGARAAADLISSALRAIAR